MNRHHRTEMMFLAIIFIVVIITIKQNYQRQLPGPTFRPIIGNLNVFLNVKKLHSTFLNLHKQYGNTIELKDLNQRIIVTRDFQLMKEISLKRDDFIMSRDERKVLIYFSGPTMFTSEGEA
jgi:patatin-like phospholipase/acyl hydrolase